MRLSQRIAVCKISPRHFSCLQLAMGHTELWFVNAGYDVLNAFALEQRQNVHAAARKLLEERRATAESNSNLTDVSQLVQ